MHDPWHDRLSEYVDEELTPAERSGMSAHLDGCPSCRAELDALRAVKHRASTLRDAAPGSDLWPGIAARIETLPRPGAPFVTRRFAFTLPQLVAAGLALMLASGGMVWLARQGGARTDFPAVMGDESPVARPANFGDAAYEDAVADLQRTLDADRGRLDPRAVAVVEANLLAIDEAIVQCRDALAKDPANVYLNTYLAETRARKLELLRRVTALADSRS